METLTIPTTAGFNPDFLAVKNAEILHAVKTKGYFAFEGALQDEYIEEMLKEVDFDKVLLNVNDVGVVSTHNNKYLTHCLANSERAYSVITHKKIISICSEYFSDNYKLVNHRIYQTAVKQHLPWHSDNNLQNGKALSEKHEMPGLMFMFYLSDADKNPFQFIEGSHKWSKRYNNENFIADSHIDKNYSKDIITFRLKKGSLIICDTHGVHRAEPFNDVNFKRKSLLFQVDEVGSQYVGHGEKNIVNTEYLKDLTPEVMDYLGFGFKRTYPAFPNTSISTMTTQDILVLQKQLLPKALKAVMQNAVRAILPSSAIIHAKKLQWYLRSQTMGKKQLAKT